MPAMTPRDVRERLMVVLEASSPGLIRSREAFSLNLQPTTVTDNSYTIEQERLREDSQTASVTARIDRITVTIARRLSMDSETAARELLDVLDDVDRRARADGVSQGYHLWPTGSRVVRPDGRDYCLGILSWTCDYDFSETVV